MNRATVLSSDIGGIKIADAEVRDKFLSASTPSLTSVLCTCTKYYPCSIYCINSMISLFIGAVPVPPPLTIQRMFKFKADFSHFALFLLYERSKGSESVWHRFLGIFSRMMKLEQRISQLSNFLHVIFLLFSDTLPRSHETFPQMFDDTTLALFDSTLCGREILLYDAKNLFDFKALKRGLPNFNYTHTEFVLATLSVRSRLYGIRVNRNATVSPVLVPVADMLNHHRNRSVRYNLVLIFSCDADLQFCIPLYFFSDPILV
jgi:hypothetical protein